MMRQLETLLWNVFKEWRIGPKIYGRVNWSEAWRKIRKGTWNCVGECDLRGDWGLYMFYFGTLIFVFLFKNMCSMLLMFVVLKLCVMLISFLWCRDWHWWIYLSNKLHDWINHILMNDIPIVLEEKISKTIRARNILFIEIKDNFFDLQGIRSFEKHWIDVIIQDMRDAFFNNLLI